MESPWARWIRHALQDVRRIRHGPPDDDGAHRRRRAAIAVADVLVAPRIAIPVVLILTVIVIVVVVVVVVEVDGDGDDGRGRSDVGVDPTTMRRRLQEAAGIFKIPFEPIIIKIRFHSRVSEGMLFHHPTGQLDATMAASVRALFAQSTPLITASRHCSNIFFLLYLPCK
jgi:hypothetical protein